MAWTGGAVFAYRSWVTSAVYILVGTYRIVPGCTGSNMRCDVSVLSGVLAETWPWGFIGGEGRVGLSE